MLAETVLSERPLSNGMKPPHNERNLEMQILIEIDDENEAFRTYDGNLDLAEIQAAMMKTATTIGLGVKRGKIFDYNGNAATRFTVKGGG